jgi:alkylmercury lyase
MADQAFETIAAAILALFPPFTPLEERIALMLYRLLAAEGPVRIEGLASSLGLPVRQIERVMSRWPGLHRDAEGTITGYGGLTTAETRHRIRIGPSTRHTWCAWDTLFIPQLLSTSAQIESACPVTGKRVAFTARPDGFEQAGAPPLLSLLAPKLSEATADIVSQFCCDVHFFASENAGREWLANKPGASLATLDQAWQLGRRHNAQRYPTLCP